VDDDEKIIRILGLQLSHHGYDVLTATNGNEALEVFEKATTIPLIILDIMLPEIDGITLCRKFREISPDAKIIMLSALDTSRDIINGLESGADDYLKKPFIFDELLARIRANLRKASQNEMGADVIKYKDLVIDASNFAVRRSGKAIELSKTEFDLLYYLVLNNNLVQSRDHILDRVWGIHYFGSNSIVDVYIKYLRDKVDKDYENKLIHTVRGRGYVVR
jgi:DNA-binding response OmpR family regulator